MSNTKHNRLERFRQWCDRWDSAVGVTVGLIGVPSIIIAMIGFAIQYQELAEAERDTKQQFQLMQETIAELGRQTDLEIEENTKEASDRFFSKRGNPLYEALFDKLEAADLAQLASAEIQDIEASLSQEFIHFQSTWQEVLNCKLPRCRFFDMLHRYHQQDICAVAIKDAQRMLTIVDGIAGGGAEESVQDRLDRSVLGEVMCLCPNDWATWGSDVRSHCQNPASINR